MNTHIIETFEPHTSRIRDAVPADLVKVGTFAAGQSVHGSYRVAAAAELGSFASTEADDQAPDTA